MLTFLAELKNSLSIILKTAAMNHRRLKQYQNSIKVLILRGYSYNDATNYILRGKIIFPDAIFRLAAF